MQETTTSTSQSEHNYSISAVDLADKLPLRLINSDVIPPAPTRSEYTIDWLPDFSGYSWLAYASSSLLVISHLPSPLSDTETNVGPIFRQIFELSGSDNASGHVSGVTWSSSGELAAALDNCIRLFSFNSTGSFCWSQTTALIQSTKVEALEWTGSGDGIISVGIEVVLWRKKCTSWEIAWKFKPELTQSLVSATWSIEGYFATAPRCNHVEGSSSTTNSASKSVIVYHSDRISKYVKTVLPHPLPVLMIQWRPSPIKQDARHQRRLLLLTCCMDGTIRLWSEIDDGRVRKVGKDIHDQRTRKLLLHVCSVIEINQVMNGSLGSDIHVRWATEINGIFNTSKEASQYFPSEYYQPDGVGKCEWVVGFGPHKQVSLWAVHCLDDVTPLRYPRVTLWKRRELEGPEVGRSSLLLRKVIIMREQVSSPPILCNLIQLLSCNSFAWCQISSQTLTSSEEPSTKSQRKSVYPYCVYGKLNMDGHSGKILQVSVHSHGYGFNFAASLDMEGFLLLWSISDNSNSIVGLPTINPTWKLSGKVSLHDCTPNYTTLSWLPPVIDEDPILLAGHAGGIDCFVVELSKKEEKLFSHKLCTIPFSSSSCNDDPNSVHAVPLSLCDENSYYCATMLLAVWNNSFKALSWKISIHHSDFSGICACTFDTGNIFKNNARMFEENISGKRYFIVVDPWSSVLPEIQNHSHVTNYDVVSPTTIVMPKKQKEYSTTELHGSYDTFHLATGHSDGRVRLWRSMATNSLNLDSQWELVSVLDTHQSQIVAVSVTDCGRKIATITSASHSDSSTILHIWEAVYLSVAGSFILEDSVVLDGKVVALDWLTLDNGQFLLGVCLRNQFRVYGQRLCGGHNLLKNESSLNRKIWVCVALNHTHPEIQDFKWGLNASAVVVHSEYFSLCSPWLILLDNKSNVNCLSRVSKNNSLDCISADKHMVTSIFRDPDTGALRDSSMEEKQRHYPIRYSNMINAPINILSSIYADNYNSDVKIGFISMLDVAEKLGGSLPFYHPEALLMNICSGNWKRAEVAVRHLADYYTSQSVPSESYCLANSGHVIPLVHLSDYFNGSLSSNSDDNAFQWRGDAASISPTLQLQHDLNYSATSWDYNTSLTFPSKKFKVGDFTEPLDKFFDLGFLKNIEKMQMRAIIDLLEEISNSASAYGSLDKPGQRFWVAIRFQQLYFLRRFGRVPSDGELVVNTSMIGWAFHSDCQDNLFNSLLSNESSWHEMRNIGVGFWYTNVTQLRLKMEKLARHQYLKTKDPKACALLYIVLNRLQVLAGLFKISKDEKDKPLVGFLSRNFKEDNNKAAALKNAYVLMGKHQLELAVAFFILGGDTASAINVCAKNLGDEQLALVISRLVEGNNGPLQFHLISKFLLPSALEKGDKWLASFLEWAIGNYSQAIVRVLGSQLSTVGDKPAFSSNYDSFLDPSIGEYCLMLATSNNMRNALGEQNAAILGRWAILMTATALNRCGLHLEGLERLSSSYSIFGGSDQGDISEIADSELLNEMLKPFISDSSSNWISSKIALHIESQGKLDMAMHYISNLLKEHPSWTDANIGYSAMCMYNKSNIQQYQVLLESFEKKLRAGLTCFEQKFSLASRHLINKMVNFLCNNGLVFIGLQLLLCYNEQVKETSNTFGGFHLFPVFPNLLLKATEEMSFLFSRYVISCSISSSSMRSCSAADRTPGEIIFNRLAGWRFQMQGLMWSLCCFRSMLKLFPGSSADDFIRKTYTMIGLCEYYVYFSSALIQRNLRALNLIVKPLLVTCKSDHVHYEFNLEDLNKLLPEIAELLTHDTIIDEVLDSAPPVPPDHDGDRIPIPIDEAWQLVKALLYGRMSGFLNHQLNSFLTVEEDSSANCLPFRLSVFVSDSSKCGLDNSNTTTQINAISAALANLLRSTSAHIYSHCERQVASSLLQKAGDGFSSPTLQWLEILCHASSQDHLKQLNQDMDNFNITNNETKLSAYEILWKTCANPELLCGGSELNISRWLKYIKRKLPKRWFELYKSTESECETEEIHKREGTLGSLHASNGVGSGSPLKGSPENSFFLGSRKDTALIKKVMPFESPTEICKRNGELLEAICVNSLNQQQAALASNRKGIVFFNREDGIPSMDNSNYIWSKADWPLDGWAGSESTPVPTCVSPGVGLGSRKGTHLGLGGATVGAGSLAKPGRDFTGGGAFGVPGYAGMGSSGLGWEIQEEFEEFVDPPATVENVRTRAFSSHPSRPLFLVGSSNTHTYLWEFGKERATATYGVLPAANVPPPYALASISAVRFDHCGQRFATAALDGTVCTWQLEVGGRSNICPTESMLCFNNCASDVTYVTASGSIIATAGYSSDAINVVIWDTLAPPTTSRASIMCHEGGARSLTVFDNDIGSGSISPFIVTGGKAGDVGVHDFRYIATGRTKRNRHSDSNEEFVNGSSTTIMRNKIGDQNSHGMLWYIPKAHTGSVTRICAVPNTNFFLTGSKDGDVKLWDAKRAKLVYHWPKLHDRHTFLQGGVIRAAVTDIQVVSNGFLTCGGDSSVKFVQLQE